MDGSQNAQLNHLLITIGRSLLQYVGESWPWTSEDSDEARRKLTELVDRQQQSVGALASLLNAREWAIDFGTYPTDYTDLHFIALDFLLAQLVENQEAVVDVLKQSAELNGDGEASQLMAGIVEAESAILSELQLLEP